MSRVYKTGVKVEMLWDCPYCSTKKILGRYKNCPNCGKTRDIGTYIEDVENHILSEQDKKIFKRIETLKRKEKTKNEVDYNSNSPLTDSYISSTSNEIETKVKAKLDKKTSSNFTTHNEVDDLLKKDVNESSSNEETPILKQIKKVDKTVESKQNDVRDESDLTKSLRKYKNAFLNHFSIKNVLFITLILICSSFLLTIIVKALMPKEEVLEVQSIKWERNIDIEIEKTFFESGWTMPYGARLLYTNREWHHDEQVVDHYETRTVTKQKYEKVGTNVWYSYEDNGDGTADQVAHEDDVYGYVDYQTTEQVPIMKTVPVYQTKYYYEIDRYVHNRNVYSTGCDHNVYWGEVILDNKEREGIRNETYIINAYNSNNELKKYHLDYSAWESINSGDRIYAKVHITGYIELLNNSGNKLNYN